MKLSIITVNQNSQNVTINANNTVNNHQIADFFVKNRRFFRQESQIFYTFAASKQMSYD